ncbi:MAG: chromosome segregation protein SMC [Oscillospiraceae bacterium]|nr:chromosome segregation protein SMC [Oscillospiraceae bacterium]
MYLKSFDMQGFKSFPDKTTLTFDNGVTAVVGPNGSGKSNIAEAVRWVLGEQSPRALRCEKKMEELIFHGTAQRGPVGFTEVSLLLDNSGGLFPLEQHEVQVTRRLYRSGESEFFINRVGVRLRDVLELFMDTGLGRDGYSLIGQGRIGEILSEKSGERRRVFEEASGISRYRHRKEEAERKLVLAEENLTRIGDKIEELELQIGPLREQAEKARQYLHMRDELRGLEIALWLGALDKLRDSYGKVRDDYEAATSQLSAGQAALDALYAELDRIGAEERQNQESVEAARADLSAVEGAAAERESAAAVLQTTRQNNEENIARLREEQTREAAHDGGLIAQIEERRVHLRETEAALASLEADIAALTRESAALGARADAGLAEIGALRVEENAAREAAGEARAAISSQAASADELTRQREAMREDIAVRARACEEAGAALAALDVQLADSAEQLTALQNVLNGHALRADAKQTQIETIRASQEARAVERGRVESRLHLLREMEREYEGHSRAVKTVMAEHERGRLPGVRGTVSELLRAEDRCAVAVEIALGPALQNIVVEREEDAKAAIELLRRRETGRATFLPLSAVRGRTLEERGLASEPGFVGVAAELVTCDETYGEIVRSLLGRTVVVESMDAAIALARRRGHRFRIVTLDGQVIAPGGAMTGGSVGKSVGLLSRKNEMDRLAAERTRLDKELAGLADSIAQADRALAEARRERDKAAAERRVAEDEALSLRAERAHGGTRLAELQAELAAQEAEFAALSERLRAGTDAAEHWRRTAGESEARAAAVSEALAALSAGQIEISEAGARLSEEIAGLRARAAACAAERTSDERALEEYESLRQTFLGGQAQKRAAIEDYEARNRVLSAEIDTARAEARALLARAEEGRAAISGLYEARRTLEGRRVRCDRQAREQNDENMKMERERSRLEAKKVAGEAEEKSIMDRLWDNYGLTHSAAVELRMPLPGGTAKANRRAGELRSAIRALGAPNLGAIEECERVSTRYEYLAEQRNDAEAARSDLLTIIGDLTGRMREIFLEQFALIGEHFTRTFREIFGGGDARLSLEDPEDALACGVEIHAQPPGKKMRSISLLSGGEKSLVAIALYFSIFKVRPAPFCVLDEVDHDLDDINVARFAAYLRRLAGDIQFVVITHRRGTMEAADMLYGVTTQEEGVSKILSMRLQDAEASLGISLN